MAIDGRLKVTGDISIGGKMYLAGSLDPSDLILTPQERNPVPAVEHGICVSDGTEPGTAKGGLYYERAGERVRLDR